MSQESKDKISKTKKGTNKGDKNPSKRPDVRKKLRENNAMLNKKHRETQKKACNTTEVREKRSNASKKKWKDLKSNPIKYKEFIEKRIEGYSKGLANGEYNIKNNWNTGYFSKKDGTKEWYDSGLELRFMNFFEKLNLKWTKKHKIRIPYINKNDINTYYVPDFLIESCTLLEVKGWMKENDYEKCIAGIKYCKENELDYLFILGESQKLIIELSHIKMNIKNYEEYFEKTRN